MGPLTSSFINQGYNFVNKKLLVHCTISLI